MGPRVLLVTILSQSASALLLEPIAHQDPASSNDIKLISPSTGPCVLKDNKTSYSQWKQDLILEPIFKNITRGFFVESGATDGESGSNTLFYEKQGWTGLLVEPDDKFFGQLKDKHRSAYLFQGALSTTKDITRLGFHPSYGGGSIVKKLKKKDYSVLAAPLSTLMQAMNRRTVDFWSLDIEGSEGAVLEGTDFKAIEFGVLLIEMNKPGSNNDRIKAVMDREGFKDIGATRYAKGGYKDINDAPPNVTLDQDLDHIYVNPRYFESRGFEVPSNIANYQ